MRPVSDWSMRTEHASQSNDGGAHGLGESEQVRLGRMAWICQHAAEDLSHADVERYAHVFPLRYGMYDLPNGNQ